MGPTPHVFAHFGGEHKAVQSPWKEEVGRRIGMVEKRTKKTTGTMKGSSWDKMGLPVG